jgi:hypothetical protein
MAMCHRRNLRLHQALQLQLQLKKAKVQINLSD